MTIKLILLLLVISTAQAQTRYSPDSLMTAGQLQAALLVCNVRGHEVPFFLDVSGGKLERYVDDFTDSTIHVVRMTEKTEEGKCLRCRQTITRIEPEKELLRRKAWTKTLPGIAPSKVK